MTIEFNKKTVPEINIARKWNILDTNNMIKQTTLIACNLRHNIILINQHRHNTNNDKA